MSVLTNSFKAAPPAARAHLLTLLRGTPAERGAAALALAESGYTAAAGVLRARVAGERPEVVDAYLTAIGVLRPEWAAATAEECLLWVCREEAIPSIDAFVDSLVRISFGGGGPHNYRTSAKFLQSLKGLIALEYLVGATPDLQGCPLPSARVGHDPFFIDVLRANRPRCGRDALARRVWQTLGKYLHFDIDDDFKAGKNGRAAWFRHLACLADLMARSGECGFEKLFSTLSRCSREKALLLAPCIMKWHAERVIQRAAREIKGNDFYRSTACLRALGFVGLVVRKHPGHDGIDALRASIMEFLLPFVDAGPNAGATPVGQARPGKPAGPEAARETDPEGRLCAAALLALARTGWPRWHKRARQMCHDPREWVRTAAVCALGELGRPYDVGAVELLFDDTDRSVRLAALAAALNLAPARRREFIEKFLADVSLWVRMESLALIRAQEHPGDVDLVEKLLSDDKSPVRQEALHAAVRLVPEKARDLAYRCVTDKEERVRLEAVYVLHVHGTSDDKRLLVRMLKDREVEVVAAALKALITLFPPNKMIFVRKVLCDKRAERRLAAIDVLGRFGTRENLSDLAPLLRDKDSRVRLAALERATKLAPETAADFALGLMTDPDRDVADLAAKLIEEACPGKIADIALRKLKAARGDSGPVLLDMVERHAPDRMDEAVAVALQSRSGPAKRKVLGWVCGPPPAWQRASVLRLARGLLKDPDPAVRLEAYRRLRSLELKKRKCLALSALADPSPEMRLEGVADLRRFKDADLVEDLLPLARDRAPRVRAMALKALRPYGDRRVLGELISSLTDQDSSVKDATREVCEGRFGKVEALERFYPGVPLATINALFLGKVLAIHTWASNLGQELLGRPVWVYQNRQGLGETTKSRGLAPVKIWVSDIPVTGGHPQGDEILRGLALHEIGHHLCDIGVRGFSTTRGIARAEGILDIYSILLDERMERILRSRRRDWGVHFDRLASYAFAQRTYNVPIRSYAACLGLDVDDALEAVEQGSVPGELLADGKGRERRVAVRCTDLLRIPNGLPAVVGFFASLRCGFDPRLHADPDVAKAMALVPRDLKSLSHGGLLGVARKIAAVIGHADEHKEQLLRLRERWVAVPGLRGMAQEVLDRLKDLGALPDAVGEMPEGIRAGGPVTAQPKDSRQRGDRKPTVKALNVEPDLEFPRLEKEEKVEWNHALHAKLAARIRPHIRSLRAYLERLGRRSIEDYGATRGHRIDLARARTAVAKRTANLLVASTEDIRADAYIGVVIDSSASMEGAKLELAKAFGVLIAESARGIRGLSGRVHAFDDDTFYDLGGLERNATSSLMAGGGNNDSGALFRAAEIALRARKRNNLLIMVSDGSPTDCTLASLQSLVQRLTHEVGFVCAQVAVERMEGLAFPHFVDVSGLSMDEAAVRFGKLLMKITAHWR